MSRSRLALLGLAFLVVGGVLAWPAVDGSFLSDDFIYIVNNPYTHGLSGENVRAILDPYGAPTVYTLNYAPVHLLLHAAEWQLWGDATRGYHVVNAVAHALTSLLLVLLLARWGVPRPAAVLGGAFFLVHPANVEVVAWIFQLKTIVSLALSMGALMLHPRRPALAFALFALAVLTKITALAVLPVALVAAWLRVGDEAAPPRWGWLAGWALFLLVIAVPELAAFERQSDVRIVIHPDPFVHARTIVAIAARYLAMAYTGYGVSTFQEPGPALSLLDPWWLAGLAALALLAWRLVVTLRRRDPEALWWLLAAGGFAPVSQIFPFIFPMGDRYLYPILPGLIGGTLLAGLPLYRRLARRLDAAEPVAAAHLAVGLALLLLGALGVQSWRRAPVFTDMTSMMVDAALNYPDGMQAALLRGGQAGARGDAEGAARAFQRAVDLGFSDLPALLDNPSLAPVRDTPAFRGVIRDLAERDIERLGALPDPEQSELMRLGLAWHVKGDLDRAIHYTERALAAEGPFTDDLREILATLRREQSRRAARSAP